MVTLARPWAMAGDGRSARRKSATRSVFRIARRLQAEAKKLNGVFAEHFFLILRRDLGAPRDGTRHLARLGRIPVRRVGGEHEAVAAQIFNRPFEETVLERLAADVDAFMEDVARPALLPRYEMRQFFPMLVHAREPPRH